MTLPAASEPRGTGTPTAEPIRALIVSYAFPPVGGAGVQRMLKLVKYLPEFNVVPAVLTAANPSVPLRDESLLGELPPGLQVLRARTFEPGYALKQAAWKASATRASPFTGARGALLELGKRLLIPDPQVLWQPAAHWSLVRRLFSSEPDRVVLVSGPPFSQYLLGPVTRLKPGTALIFDYRDEWSTLSSSYEMSSGAAERAAALLEGALLKFAHAVTTATDAFRDELCRRFPFLDPARVHTIPNGFDPEDFAGELPGPPSDRFVLTYAGTIFRLTSARGLISALRRLKERDPELLKLLELRLIGRIVETEREYFEGGDELGVRLLGYMDHSRVIRELSRSHATLCILDDVPGCERILPAKIFELMRLGRPCLTLAPRGALSALIRRHRAGEVVPPRDVEAISEALARMLRAFRDGRPLPSAASDVERYDRRRQAAEFAAIFRRALADAAGAGARPDSSSPRGLGTREFSEF